MKMFRVCSMFEICTVRRTFGKHHIVMKYADSSRNSMFLAILKNLKYVFHEINSAEFLMILDKKNHQDHLVDHISPF